MTPDDVSIDAWLSQDPSDPGAVSERYDAWAQSYDEDLAAWDYRAPTVVAQTVVRRQPSAASLLDVGCGTGLVGRTLRAHGYTGRMSGLDLSSASLALARERGAYETLEEADLQQPLPGPDGEFDALVCVGVMTYLPDVEAVWREFARVCRPGGLIVLTQREDLWEPRECPAVVERLQAEGVWSEVEVSGPAAYLPVGYGGTPEVGCYYLSVRVV